MRTGAFLIIGTVCCLTAQAEPLSLNSEGFAGNTLFPVLYSCDGKGISPPLSWTNAPKNTKSYSLVVYDTSSAKPLYQWVVFNIPSTVSSFDEGTPNFPPEATMGRNSWGKSKYSGLCPPKGKVHTYSFSLYALDRKLQLSPNAKARDVLHAMKGAVIQKADIRVSYSRWPWAE